MQGVCLNSWQAYGCEWSIGYLWGSMDWLVRLDVVALALMLVYIVIVLSVGSYRYHLARRQSRAFVRDAATPLQGGALDEVITIAARNGQSPVAMMAAAGLTAFISARPQSTISEATDAASRSFHRSQRKIAADLGFEMGALKSIASTAPFLGLAGTCLGILSAFGGVGMEKSAALAMIAARMAAALITTAAGLLVVVPAVWSYNYLRACKERLQSEMSDVVWEAITQLRAHPQWRERCEHFDAASQTIVSGPDANELSHEIRYDGEASGRSFKFAEKLPLAGRFSDLPAFPLMAAPSLALLVVVFTIFGHPYTPRGLYVQLLKSSEEVTRNHFSVEPIVIGLFRTKASGLPAVYVSSEKTHWKDLDGTIRSKLKVRAQPIAYVEADNDVPWANVVDVIDVLKGFQVDVVLLTNTPNNDSRHMH